MTQLAEKLSGFTTGVQSAVILGANAALVSGVSGKKIRVVALHLSGSSGVGVLEFEDSSGGDVIWRTQCGAGVGPSLAREDGLFETSDGNDLAFTVSGGGVIRGAISYVFVEA